MLYIKMKINIIILLQLKINAIFVSMKGFVYGIKCPILKRIIYIGATMNTKSRFSAHRSGNYRTKIGLYVKSLRLMNLNISFEILEEVDISNRIFAFDVYIQESIWIKNTLDKGIELLNYTGGPKGIHINNKKI